jgi:hypothetical protein
MLTKGLQARGEVGTESCHGDRSAAPPRGAGSWQEQFVDLPDDVSRVVDRLAAMGGVEAVLLGGSRAAGTATADSDWDLGAYYREPLDLSKQSMESVLDLVQSTWDLARH